MSCSAFPRVVSGWTGERKLEFLTWNEMVWVSTRPVIVTVYVPAAIPVVSMLTLTVPLPSQTRHRGCSGRRWRRWRPPRRNGCSGPSTSASRAARRPRWPGAALGTVPPAAVIHGLSTR